MNPKLKIVSAMVTFGTISIFVKNIPLSSGEIALFRAVIAAISIIFFKLFTREKIEFPSIKKDLPVLFLSGVAMAFNWIFLFQAYKYTSVSLATLSYYFAPVIVTLACPILFGERLSTKQIVCFIMASLGLVLIIGIGGLNSSANGLLGIAYGLAAAALYATVIILNKYIKTITGIDKTLIQFIAAIIILVPYLLFTSGIHLNLLNVKGSINLLILGVVHTGVMYCLYFSSVKDLRGQQAAIFSYIDPLVAIIISITVLKESISFLQVIGGILILGFTLLNEIDIKYKKILRSQ